MAHFRKGPRSPPAVYMNSETNFRPQSRALRSRSNCCNCIAFNCISFSRPLVLLVVLVRRRGSSFIFIFIFALVVSLFVVLVIFDVEEVLAA